MASLTLSFLGTFQAKWQDTPITRFRSDKIRALFAYLAVESDVSHRREILATLLWPDSSNAVALRNLRKSLHRLRQTLDEYDPGLSELVLSVDRQTVTWHSETVTLDVYRFLDTLSAVDAHNHHSLDRCTDCLPSLAEAVALYQGDFLAGVSVSNAIGFEEWVVMKREMLHQKALSTLHKLTAAHEQLGDFDQAYVYGMRQVSLEPWREEAHRQLMRVLALQGEHSRALKQYQQCCDILIEELGASPTHLTVELYEQISQGDFLGATADHENELKLHHFPTQFTPFVGRTKEIETITEHLLDQNCRLLTLTGAGGIGKTRLSLEAILHIGEHQLTKARTLFRDGCYFVPLAEVFSKDQLAVAIENALQFTFQTAENLEEQLVAYLADKRLLIVLDNFEQLVNVAHDLISRLLHAAPAVQFLISSREPLQLQAERQLRLEGLPYPDDHHLNNDGDRLAQLYAYDGISLFVQAAQHAQPSFEPDEADLLAIARICRLTHGAPLALEIAAVWVKMIDCQAIAEQITQSLDFLKTTQRDTPDRHRSIRAVFEQSWHSLSHLEQVTLAQISIFRGGFSLEAALVVLDDALQVLSPLLDKSLLRRDETGRYQTHALLQQFAAEKLSEIDPDIGRQAAERHCQYYFDLIVTQREQFYQAATRMSLETAQRELDNLRHAWHWAATHGQWEKLLKVIDGLDLFYHIPSSYQDNIASLTFAIDQVQTTLRVSHKTNAQQLLNRLRIQLIRFYLERYKFKEAKNLARDTSEDCRLHGPNEHLVMALADFGIVSWRLGDVPGAMNALTESLELARTLSMPLQVAYALHHLGNIAITQKQDYEQASGLLIQAMNLYEKSGTLHNLASVLNDLGSLNFAHDNLEIAQTYYERSLNLYRRVNSISGCILPLNNMIYSQLVIGDYESAQFYCETFNAFAAENHVDSTSLPSFLTNRGNTALMRKEYRQAAQDYKKRLRSSVLLDGEKLEILLGLTAIIIVKGDQAIASQLLTVVDDAWGDNPPVVSPFERQLLQRCKEQLTVKPGTGLGWADDKMRTAEAIEIALAEIESIEALSGSVR